MANWNGMETRWLKKENIIYTDDIFSSKILTMSDEFPEDMTELNMDLICDAGNTIQKCDLLPSELLQMNIELTQSLKSILKWTAHFPDAMNDELVEAVTTLSKSISITKISSK